MSQPHPSLASSRNATEPTRSVQPAAQHFSYPFVLCDKQAPDTMQGHFNALSEMPVGFFPLATSGLANGSLHFGKEATGFLIEKGFRCLADGEVVAYKLDSKLQKLVYGPNEVVFYSLGFVLVRHRLVLPQATQREATTEDRSIVAPAAAADADADDGAYIFSLYSYNRAFRDYPVDRDDFLLESMPFWQGSHRYRVGNRANDRQLTVPEAFAQEHIAQGVSEIYTIMPEWLTPVIDPLTKNTVTVPPPVPAVGLRVREHGRGTAKVIGLLPRDCILTVRGTSTSGWAQIAAFERGNPLPHVVEGNFSQHPIADGWVFLGELDHTVMPSPLDKVVILDAPHPVKAGDLLGYLGENPGRDLAEEEDAPPRRRPRVAIEVFAGNDFPEHLAKARRRAADLPGSEKTVLIIERGAKLCEQARSPEHIVDRWHYIVPHAKSPTTGPYVCGTVYGAESVATNIPLDFGDYRASAKGDKRIDSETYNELKAAKQSAYPIVLKPVRELGFCWGHRRHEIGGRYMSVWTRPPLVPTEGTIVATFARSFSRAELDALPEERRFVDYDGSHWWQVFIAVEGNQSKLGWVRDRDHPDTRWESPHAWPCFEVVDGSMFEPMEALMRIVCIEGDVHPKHEESFQPVATALSKSEMIVKLEEAIDHAGSLDGAVTAGDIEEARRTPWLAHGLSRLICRFQSQWSPDIERWSKLMPYMESDWLVEMERQKERGWWKSVAGKVEGFPEDPHVYHVHPFGWVDNFTRLQSAPSLDALFTELGSLISAKEGSYEAYNAGTKGVPLKDGKAQVKYGFLTRPKGTVTGRTIDQILATDSLSGMDPNRLFATGKYQTVIITLDEAKRSLGLTGDELYDESMQERVFREHLLAKGAGKVVRQFILEGNVEIADAQYAAAKVWASICAPLGYVDNAGNPTNGRETYYKKDGANHASIEATESLVSFLRKVQAMHATGALKSPK